MEKGYTIKIDAEEYLVIVAALRYAMNNACWALVAENALAEIIQVLERDA
jgi:hypothetical protein